MLFSREISQSNILVRSTRDPIHTYRPREYLSLQFPRRIKMYMEDDRRLTKPTLQSIKKAKSLASIRLLAASKMRVKSSRPSFKLHLFQPFSRYASGAFVINPLTQRLELAVNFKSTTPNPLETYCQYGKRQSRESIGSIDIIKREIKQELRKRQESRRQSKKFEPKKRIQSGKHPPGLMTGSPMRSQRAVSARNIRPTVTNNIQITPWEPLRGEQPDVFP